MNPQRQARFWAKVQKSSGCWEWQACTNGAGYGIVGIGGKRVDRAHRVSYRLHKGEIPAGLFVCHTCDNRRCVRPDHLFLGTNQDNVDDMVTKGRNSKPPLMAGWNRYTYSDGIVACLGKMPDTELAVLAGVTKYAIQRERRRRGVPAFPSLTRFKKGDPHPRWHRRKEVEKHASRRS